MRLVRRICCYNASMTASASHEMISSKYRGKIPVRKIPTHLSHVQSSAAIHECATECGQEPLIAQIRTDTNQASSQPSFPLATHTHDKTPAWRPTTPLELQPHADLSSQQSAVSSQQSARATAHRSAVARAANYKCDVTARSRESAQSSHSE